MFFDTLATSVPLHRAGKLKILAVADLQRAKTAPELPTFTEAGVPGFRSITWFGLVAPPGTPAALAQRINRDAVEMLRSPEVVATAAKPVARGRRDEPRGNRDVLRRRDRAVGQGDQGSRHHAAVGSCGYVKLREVVLAALLALLAPFAATAQDAKFPSRAVTLVVPFPPGGSADALPRIVAEKLRERWGHPVIIENRPARGLDRQRQRVPRTAGRNHPARHTRRPAGDQRTRSEDAALRAFGVRPGRAAGAVADRADGTADFSGEQRRGIDRLRPRQPRQAELRLARCRRPSRPACAAPG